MNKPLISVVVPVYNIANYLERSVKSIREQTYRHLEIILVDNGSTDGGTELVDELAKTDERIVPLHVEKKGVSFARLEGVKAASGEWIGFVDGDDVIEPDMYERLLNNALKYSAQISHCGYQMVFPSRIDYYYNTGRLVQQDNLTGLKDLLDGSFVEPGLCNKLFHKTLFYSLLHSAGFDLNIKTNEDLLMNYYLFKGSTNSIFEDFCPYHYMVRNNSTATSVINENKLRDPLKVKKIIKADCGDNELELIIDKNILNHLINLATMDCTTNKKLIKPYKDSALRELRKDINIYLKGSFSVKQKVSAVWVAVWPASYRWVHTLYAKATGIDKKYEVS